MPVDWRSGGPFLTPGCDVAELFCLLHCLAFLALLVCLLTHQGRSAWSAFNQAPCLHCSAGSRSLLTSPLLTCMLQDPLSPGVGSPHRRDVVQQPSCAHSSQCPRLAVCVLQVWAVPTTMMQCDWLGERVATVDVDR